MFGGSGLCLPELAIKPANVVNGRLIEGGQTGIFIFGESVGSLLLSTQRSLSHPHREAQRAEASGASPNNELGDRHEQ